MFREAFSIIWTNFRLVYHGQERILWGEDFRSKFENILVLPLSEKNGFISNAKYRSYRYHSITHVKESVYTQWRHLNPHGGRDRMELAKSWWNWPTIILKLTRKTSFRLRITFWILIVQIHPTYQNASIHIDLSYPALKNRIECCYYSELLFLADYWCYTRTACFSTHSTQTLLRSKMRLRSPMYNLLRLATRKWSKVLM